MKSIAVTLAAVLNLAGAANAGAIPQPGDFYLISRDRDGFFVGSHKLFFDYSGGLNKVSYCNRQYYVRSHSVAWTQLETERGNTVQVEFNFGRGWRPICGQPERQVTLADIGISISAEDVLASDEEATGVKSRLSAISAIFNAGKKLDGYSTYHTR